MKNDDELLDEIIAHLRDEPVPEMPPELIARGAAKRRGWLWPAIAAAVLAASLAGLALWRGSTALQEEPLAPDVVQQENNHSPRVKSGVAVREIDLAQPLVQLEANLDMLDAEIAELVRQAKLLDARRLAEDLLAQVDPGRQ